MDKALIIFLLTYVVIAIGRPPLFRIDRAGAALIGASLMIVTGVIDIEAAYRAIDYRTIVLLFSLMIVVANLRLSGLFPLVSAFVVRRIGSPTLLLYAVVFMSGSLSALLINDTVCMAFTPPDSGDNDAPRVESGSLSAGALHGFKYRQRRDHYGESAEYHDRQLLGH